MNIFIMRHGEASFTTFIDKDRPLTARGEDQASEQGSWLVKHAIPEQVLVSPYLRAQQTYQYMQQHFKKAISVETWENLTPYGHAELVVDYLDTLQQDGIKNILIVSHLPLVDEIMRALGVKEEVIFHPATIVHLEKLAQSVKLVEYKVPVV
ncbi:phosphohistidine phosphatase SixA [Gallibacterium trehalosifermentans]|uniref:Phosphohistidine phosphatase SixA n=1 Tax=Gallibacterium trehalosifermentans TaxID=516935 RepID=A0ABV6GYE5_9PAST